MTEDARSELNPGEYILKLFEDTNDGELEIYYFPFLGEPFARSYKVDWQRADAENTVKRYNFLTAALARIGGLGKELDDEAKREELLSPEELEVWNIYIRPFEPFEVDSEIINDLNMRLETDSLEKEELELLDRYDEWFVTNSRKRLPSDRCCPAKFINRARRYAKLTELKAPEIVILEEGRCLAEEMVLYYNSINN